MKRKLLWVVASCLMILSLLIVSCGQTDEPTTGPGIVVKTEPGSTQPGTTTGPTTPATEAPKQEEVVDSSQPRYGGSLILPVNTNPTYWDPQDHILQHPSLDLTMQR